MGAMRTAEVLLASMLLALAGADSAPASLRPVFASDAEAQEETFSTMNELGQAMLSWLTDNASSWVPARLDVADYELMSHAELAARLVPLYIDAIPSYDAWGNRFEFYLPSDRYDLIKAQVILIRSPGRDGQFDSQSYNPGSFSDQQYDRDLVWADGVFFRWPRRLCERKQQIYKNVCQVPAPLQ